MVLDTLILERSDGWPRRTARLCLVLGLVLLLAGGVGAVGSGAWTHGLAGAAASGLMCLGMALALGAWRRGVTLHRDNLTLCRWWGLVLPGLGTRVIRELDQRSVAGYTAVTVEPVPAHYKSWKEMYRILLIRPPDLDQVVVDDEFASLAAAAVPADQVAGFLSVRSIKGRLGKASR